MKAFTDIGQSKKLAEILLIDSADMRYGYIAPYEFSDRKYDGGYDMIPYHKDFFDRCSNFSADEYDDELPCWSLAALLDILPETIEDKYGEYELNIDMIYKRPEYVRLCDCNHCDFPSWDWDNKELLDNIVEAVIWLNNNGYLRNEKLY